MATSARSTRSSSFRSNTRQSGPSVAPTVSKDRPAKASNHPHPNRRHDPRQPTPATIDKCRHFRRQTKNDPPPSAVVQVLPCPVRTAAGAQAKVDLITSDDGATVDLVPAAQQRNPPLQHVVANQGPRGSHSRSPRPLDARRTDDVADVVHGRGNVHGGKPSDCKPITLNAARLHPSDQTLIVPSEPPMTFQLCPPPNHGIGSPSRAILIRPARDQTSNAHHH